MIDRVDRGELEQKAAQLEIEHFWAGALRRAVIDGDVENGSLMAGQSVGMVTSEQPVAEILAELVDQAVAALADAPSRPRRETATPDRGRRLMPQPGGLSVPAAPASSARCHGGRRQRPGPARPDRQHHRRRDGGGGLLRLRHAPRRGARAVRHQGPEARGGAPDAAARRRGPGRRHRRPRAAAGPGRGAVPSQFRLPAGDRRGDLSIP